MHSALTEAKVVVPSIAQDQRLHRFMNAYWLRPENALWMALRSQALSDISWAHRSIDLSCGDGVFSFLHAGGQFEDDFDVFTSILPQNQRNDEKDDIFDHCDGRYKPVIVSPPQYGIDVGTDLKPNLLAKAGRLGLYEELEVHDNNQPLPFETHAFQTVYCNSIYWVENIDQFLAEMSRITAPDGQILLEVKMDSVLRYTLESHRERLGDRFLDIIGRGRAGTWPSMGDQAQWESRFAKAGLSITKATSFVTRTHAHIWDVGLRPIAPMLIELANSVTAQTRSRVKKQWVDLFCELCEPFFQADIDLLPGGDEPAEILYELKQTV